MIKIRVGKKNLTEEKIGDKFYLYHASITMPDLSYLKSFRNGIKVNSKSYAATQGAGFYLFQNKRTALNRLNSDTLNARDGENYQPFEKEKDGYKLLVTLEASDLDPTKFVIDNEISIEPLMYIILSHFEELSKLKFKNPKIGLRFNKFDTFSTITFKTEAGMGSFSVSSKMGEGSIRSGEIMGSYLRSLSEEYPEIFSKIQREMLSDARADAIKYVGKETIMPYKLEILDHNGNLIDVTNKDP